MKKAYIVDRRRANEGDREFHSRKIGYDFFLFVLERGI
jgi:hypothetical protein